MTVLVTKLCFESGSVFGKDFELYAFAIGLIGRAPLAIFEARRSPALDIVHCDLGLLSESCLWRQHLYLRKHRGSDVGYAGVIASRRCAY